MDKVITNLSQRLSTEENPSIELTKYGEKGYWEQRFVAEEGKVTEWLEDYKSLKIILFS
jgi:hypothetical protein